MLTDRRIAHMAKKPLTAIEFIQPMAKVDPVYMEEEDSFKVLSLALALQHTHTHTHRVAVAMLGAQQLEHGDTASAGLARPIISSVASCA